MAALPADAEALVAALEAWLGFHARDLPWRRERSPYRVWLSEIMLQQTRVATVEAYFRRFCERFPTVEDLAAAHEDEVLALWSGLGYYSRGRNLHRAARAVVARGAFPDDEEGLLALPGVGAYTAAAVASLAFGRPAAVVDGNVARVLSRLCDDPTPVGTPAALAATRARAQALVDAAEASGPINEGLMELGALVCVPRAPRCEACPWSGACRAEQRGTAAELPRKLPKRARKKLLLALAVLHTDDERVWLERNDQVRLFGGLYAPPSAPLDEGIDPRRALLALLGERGLGRSAPAGEPVVVRRTLTHRDLEMQVWPVPLSAAAARRLSTREAAPAGRLVARSALDELGLSTATRKVLSAVLPVAEG